MKLQVQYMNILHSVPTPELSLWGIAQLLTHLIDLYRHELLQVPGEDPQGPQFKSFPRSATVDRNGAASFACELEKPAKSVTWMKDGKELREVPMKTRITGDKTRKVPNKVNFYKS